MAKSKKSKDAVPGLTGVAFTIQASKDQTFANFRIVTLFLVDGEVVHTETSQPFATFEALARTEVFLSAAIWNLSSRYADGDFMSLGGDQRDELVNRIKKHDPALLEKIAPALYMPRAET
jgi:hypothetical protein